MGELGETAKRIIRNGGIRVKVKRSGMLQFMPFAVKNVDMGSEKFVELFVDRVIDLPELQRVAKETGLPVEAANVRVFPEGKAATDFIVRN